MSTYAGSRFSEISAHNHQAWLWNISLMSLTFSFLTLAMRMIVKWRMYGIDDAALAVGYALALGHWGALFSALREGVGKDTTLVSVSLLDEASRLIFIGRVLLLLALALSKCTVFLFIRNLFTHETKGVWRACNVLSVIAMCWGVGSVLIVSIGCSTTDLLTGSSQSCSAEKSRWTAIAAIDAAIELGIAGFSIYLFGGLHMRIDRKITVISAFFFRLPLAAIFMVFLTAQLNYLSTRDTAKSTSLAIVNPLICLEALVCYALVSATIPCLRGFLGRFRTGDLAHVDDSTGRYGNEPSGQEVTGPSFQLKSLKSLKASRRESDGAIDELALFQGNGYGHNAGAVENTATAAATFEDTRYNTTEESRSVQSIGSEEMIIHRQTVVEVRRE